MKENETIAQFILGGNKMMAIKHLRDAEGVDLRSAKAQVEALESKLKNRFPDKFGLPGTPLDQKQSEQIVTSEDLSKALSSSHDNWTITSFEKIPMGWSAVVTNGRKELTIWSHKGDIEASVAPYDPPEADRSLLAKFPDTLSDSQQVHHILDAATRQE